MKEIKKSGQLKGAEGGIMDRVKRIDGPKQRQ